MDRRHGVSTMAAVVVLALALVLVVAPTDGRHTAGAAHGRTSVPHARAPRRRRLDPTQRVLAYAPFIVRGGDRRRDVALTFDDGPGPYTGQLLAVLARLHVHATFFAVGAMERYFAAQTAAEQRAHDVVGDHTQTHALLVRLPPAQQATQIAQAAAAVSAAGAAPPRLFRPPYGLFDAATLQALRARRMLMVLWTVDTEDYLRPGVATIVRLALAGARPGAILLMHDGGGDRSQTIAAVPQIVAALRARHFRLVTIPRLLADDPPPRLQRLPPTLRRLVGAPYGRAAAPAR
jgi:peptidoglycan/xylan/chitin deacetylase (PgdA/CDA1 family)